MMTILISMLMSVAVAEEVQFNRNSAHVLGEGNKSVGVFAPLRVGLNSRMDLEIHPGWALFAPHAALKVGHVPFGKWNVVSRHQIGYPTPLLKGLARGGTGGVLAPDSEIPHTVVLQNEMLLSKDGKTFALGASLGLELGESDYATIDYAYGFRQTNLYQNTVSLHFAAGHEEFFTDSIGYRSWTKGWYYPLAEEKWVLEDRTSLLWQVSDKSQASVGVNLSYAQYPWGVQWHAFPAADWVWSW